MDDLKTFTGRDMAEALLLVRAELGSDAVVVHTRSMRRGGFLGIGSRAVVEVTAEPGRAVGRRRREEARRSPRADLIGSRSSRPRDSADVESVAPSTGDLIKKTYAAAMAELERKRAVGAGPPSPTTATLTTAASATAASGTVPVSPHPTPSVAELRRMPEHQQLIEEMRAVKGLVTRMMRAQSPAALERATTQWGSGIGTGDPLFDQYLAMIESEVAEELAEEVIASVRDEMDAVSMKDADACRAAVRAELARQFHVDADAGETLRPTPDGRPRTIALVGPTGVGKTTTIAKLAAKFHLTQSLHVGLITLDTYRIAAVEQLRTYAQIIGVPLHVAADADELRRAIGRCRGCDVILIDTAGRSPRNAAQVAELAGLIDAADPHEVHLVLASTCKQRELMETVKTFSEVRTDRIIFTKLDEAATFGTMINVARSVDKRLSYLTTGQEVPHMIEPTRPERLAALVMGDRIIDARDGGLQP